MNNTILIQPTYWVYLVWLICIGACTTGCEEAADPCDLVTCQNNADCVVDENGEFLFCDCLPGYFGEQCENFDICLTIDCQNGGTCQTDSDGEPYCECPPEFMGVNCLQDNPCFGMECAPGQICLVNLNSEAECQCPPGFTGFNCADVDPCYNNNCPENATCNNGDCLCIPGYEGQDCSVETRLQYLGNYSITTICDDGSNLTNTSAIVVDPTDITKVRILDIGLFSQPLTLIVQAGNTFDIPLQNAEDGSNYIGVEAGTFNPDNGKISFHIIRTHNSTTATCLIELTPQ